MSKEYKLPPKKTIGVITISVLVAPALTKARTISNVEIGAAKISYIVPLNFGKKIPKDVLLIDCVNKVNIKSPGTI